MTYNEMQKKLREIISSIPKALGITVLAFLLSMVLAVPFNAITTAVVSAPEKNDLRMADMFAQFADNRSVSDYDDRIVLVNIGAGGREEIAELLGIVEEGAPKVIGLDVNFPKAGAESVDSLLVEAVSLTGNMVCAQTVTADNGKFSPGVRPFFYGQVPGMEYGVVTWPTENPDARVRQYRVDFPVQGDTLVSFAGLLAERYSPGALRRFRSHDSELGIIDFPSRRFPVYDAGEVADHLEDLTGKIVLIGGMNDLDDSHATPVSPRMPGVQIHAHIIANLIDGDWPVDITYPYDALIALAACFIMVMISLNLKKDYKGIAMRFLQVGCAYLAIRTGYWLYVDHAVILDLTTTLLMITFGMFAIDVWNGIWYFGNKIFRARSVKFRGRRGGSFRADFTSREGSDAGIVTDETS